MTDASVAYLSPEGRARGRIDEMLAAAGWVVQDARAVNLAAARGQAVGVLEAKKEGETLTGVAWQTAKYLDGLPDEIPTALEGALPFAYQSTGVETRFTNTLDPEHASRDVFWFHRPETLAGWIEDVLEAMAKRGWGRMPSHGRARACGSARASPRGCGSRAPARARARLRRARAAADGDRLGRTFRERLFTEVIAQEIVEDMEAALAEFAAIAESLRPGAQVVTDP